MSRLNWTKFDGAEFESLVHSILFFTEPGVVLFGRPGPDRGQDAISADHSHVYQAKYSPKLTTKDAIRRAKEELTKIRAYKTTGSPQCEFWKDVTKWTLVANFEKNPDDDTIWTREVVDAFKDIGFEIDFWDATELDNRLIALQDVEEAYFGGINRCFLSLWEARNVLQSGVNGKYYFAMSLAGRDAQIQKVKQFEDDTDKRFMFVRGLTASGKSRFLYEAALAFATDGWRVFWGMPESMAASDSWMKGISNTSEKTLLVIDDPRDANLVQRVYEQLSVRGYRSWKALFSCHLDRQGNLATRVESRIDTSCDDLSMLTSADIDNMIKEFVGKYPIRVPHLAEEELVRLTKGAPGMISFLLGDCAERGVPLCISETVLNFARQHIDRALEAIPESDRRNARTVLRWVCAWRTVAVDNASESENAIVNFLANEIRGVQTVVEELLSKLVNVGLIVHWGKTRRIFTAEPTLLRQETLSEWLLERDESGYKETDEGKRFVKRLLKENIPEREKLIDNLAQLSVSYLDEDRGTSFLAPIFSELKREAVGGDVLTQFAVFEWLKKVFAADPESSLDILTLILDNRRPDKLLSHQYWGEQTVSHSHILVGVGMFLLVFSQMRLPYLTASKLWKLIRRNYDEETQGTFEPNVGEKMSELLPRMLSSMQSSESLQKLAYETLSNDCKSGSFTGFDKLIAHSLLASRRESVMSCNRRILFSHSYIMPGSPQWDMANDTRNLLFSLVGDDLLSMGVELVWEVLSEAHYGWRSSEMLDAKAAKVLSEYYDPIVMGDLKRTLSTLEKRVNQISKRELAAARRLWVTALEYGKSDEERGLAAACEGEYEKYFKWRFPEFFNWHVDTAKLAPQIDAIKKIFETADATKDINAFFKDAHEYLLSQDPEHPDADCCRGHDVAFHCKGLYKGNKWNAYGEFLVHRSF